MRKELQRDEGLDRLSRGTRWLAAGALVSAGCLSVAVAETLPGRSSAATPRTARSTTPSTAGPATAPPQTLSPATAPPQTLSPATAPPQTLSPATAPPQTANTQPVVSSGGS